MVPKASSRCSRAALCFLSLRSASLAASILAASSGEAPVNRRAVRELIKGEVGELVKRVPLARGAVQVHPELRVNPPGRELVEAGVGG